MFKNILDILYPKYCTVCKRHGDYLCDSCRKSFKRNLPECYICRRLSPNYTTHFKCKNRLSLDHVYVEWEYNASSSQILKMYKYKNVSDISGKLSKLLVDGLLSSGYYKQMKSTLLIPVPISYSRAAERGFNQTELIVNRVCQKFGCEKSYDWVKCKNTQQHMAGQSKKERSTRTFNPFFIDKELDISKYTNITILDDVITTGKTLENMAQIMKDTCSYELEVNAICLFRGKPYYL